MSDFKVWQNPVARLYKCQTCGFVVPWERYEDKLAKHAKKHEEKK